MANESGTPGDREPRDDHYYDYVVFEREGLELFTLAVASYGRHLSDDMNALSGDSDLADFLGSDFAKRSPLSKELNKVGRVDEWLHGLRVKMADDWDMLVPGISHGTIRYLKSIAALYVGQMLGKRDELAARPVISRYALSDVDAKIARCRETLVAGVFGTASPMELLVPGVRLAPAAVEAAEPSVARGTTPRPVILGELNLMDAELRHRCMDLYGKFSESDQQDRLDTVVSEATRVLEDRLRRRVKAPVGCDAKELIRLAFHPDGAQLVVSPVAAEQEAIYLLFRGVFGFVRNPVHHRLVGGLAPDRVLEIMGMIDYCLAVIEEAPPPAA